MGIGRLVLTEVMGKFREELSFFIKKFFWLGILGVICDWYFLEFCCYLVLRVGWKIECDIMEGDF